MIGVSAPPRLILGQSATLECNFDLEGSKIYSVKWYKNGKEFFRYMPSLERHFDVFSVEGIHIDLAYSNRNTVHLSTVSLSSNGIYRCEVSNEFPDFDTVSQSVQLTVVAIPSGPKLSSLPQTVDVGDHLQVNCSTSGSLPEPTIQWYLNRQPILPSASKVRNSNLKFSHGRNLPMAQLVTTTRTDGRFDSVNVLSVRLGVDSFQAGRVTLKCSAFLKDFFMKSEEVILEKQRLPKDIKTEVVKEVIEDDTETLSLFANNPYREEPFIFNNSELFKSDIKLFLIISSISSVLHTQVV